MAETNYIQPNLVLENDFEELLRQYREYGGYLRIISESKSIQLGNILSYKNTFVVAEPGHGKTRLLKELERMCASASIKVQRIELKNKREGQPLKDYINSKTQIDNLNLALLDGLDEVPTHELSHVIDEIKDLMDYSNALKVVVSCRIHFFEKFEAKFRSIKDSNYILIEPLSRSDAKGFLVDIGLTKPQVETVINSFRKEENNQTIIQNPRYLEMLASEIEKDSTIINHINRSTIFDNFVNSSLEIENQDKSSRQIAMLKERFLENLALTMEIAQTNSISEDEMITFIDKSESDVKQILLQQTTLEDIYERSLLIKTDGKISFTNSELQEYLSAKAISRLPYISQNVYDLAFEPNLREMLPSWYNTLSFILDENPDLLKEFIHLDKVKSGNTKNEAWHKILTGLTSAGIDQSTKSEVFDTVVDYYLSKQVNISDEIAFNTASYASTVQVKKLLDEVQSSDLNDDTEVLMTIIRLRIIKYCIELDKLTSTKKNEFTNLMIIISKNHNDARLVRAAIDTLGQMKDSNLLAQLKEIDSSDQLVQDGVQRIAFETDPNHPDSIAIFLDGLSTEHDSYSRIAVEKIDDPESIKLFIKGLIDNPNSLKRFIDYRRSSFEKSRNGFLDSLKNNFNKDLLQLLKDLILAAYSLDSGYYAGRSDFIDEAVKTVYENDKDYSRSLLEVSLKSDELRLVFNLHSILAMTIKPEDIDLIIDLINMFEDKKWLFFRIITGAIYSDNPKKKQIEKIGREKLPKLFDEHDKQIKQQREEATKRGKPEEELMNNIRQATEGSFPALIKAVEEIERNYRDSSSDNFELSKSQLDEIWELLKQKVLDPFDPAITKVDIKEYRENGTGMRYSITSLTPIFALVVKFAVVAGIDEITNYRKKIISLIPYAYTEDTLAIQKLISDLDDEEKKLISGFYDDLSNDNAKFMPGNLIDFAEKYDIQEAAETLKVLSESKSVHQWDRVRALKVSNNLMPDEDNLLRVFGKHKDPDHEWHNLAIEANSLLVSKFKNRDAIDFLFDYLKSSAVEFVEELGVHRVSSIESELHDGKLLKPLMELDDLSYKDKFDDLLDFSFELIGRGIKWNNYAMYLWKAVDQYYKNLVVYGSFDPVNELEKLVSNSDNTSMYTHHINELKKYYIEKLSKPSFSEAINTYNNLSKKDYLDINSDYELHYHLRQVIEKIFIPKLIGEGHKIIKEKKMQKTIAVLLENSLFRYGAGFRPEDVVVIREPEALDDTKPDYAVYYGFYGPVVVELKRSGHDDLSGNIDQKESYKSLKGYIQKFGAKKAILLVYDDQNMTDEQWKAFLQKITQAYSKIDGAEVIGVKRPFDPDENKEDN